MNHQATLVKHFGSSIVSHQPYASKILTCSDIQHHIFVQRRQHHLKLSQNKCLEKNWSRTRLIWDWGQIAGQVALEYLRDFDTLVLPPLDAVPPVPDVILTIFPDGWDSFDEILISVLFRFFWHISSNMYRANFVMLLFSTTTIPGSCGPRRRRTFVEC